MFDSALAGKLEAEGEKFGDKMMTRKVLSVDGIALSDGGHEANVEFSWEWTDWKGPEKGRATLRLYDDGWRVEKVE